MIFIFVIERNICLPNQLFLSGAQNKQVPLPIYAFFFIYLFIYFFIHYLNTSHFFGISDIVNVFLSSVVYFIFCLVPHITFNSVYFDHHILLLIQINPPLSSLNLMSSGLISCSINYLATLNISLF